MRPEAPGLDPQPAHRHSRALGCLQQMGGAEASAVDRGENRVSNPATDPNCLHCKISLAIIEHFRAEQGLPADQYPDLGSPEVFNILNHLAQVVADTITPCENGEAQLLRRVGLVSARIIKFAMEDLKREASPIAGVRLQ